MTHAASPSTRFSCPSCQRRYGLRVKVLPFFCSCGARLDEITYLAASPYAQPLPIARPAQDLPCYHRGGSLREINCGCSGKPKIYSCDLHGECYLRKLPKMPREQINGKQMCLDCDDRQVLPTGKIGFLLQVFNQSGGMETWARIMIDKVADRSFSGIYALKSNCTDRSLRIHTDPDAAMEVCEQSDIIFVWGHIPNLASLREEFASKTFVAVHHGSLASSWAQQVFAEALPLCHAGIAVNAEVAWHWGVSHLPNPTVDRGIRTQAASGDSVKDILWNHRWSPEKRPQLALEIAKALPSGYRMLISAPKHVQMPPNCVNIGQGGDNACYLARSSVFLSTADQEAFGYSLAEAAYARVPIVCGPYGIGSTVGAAIVQSDDPQVWVSAILKADFRLVDRCALWLEENHGASAIEAWRSALKIV
jgi:hypothetical protein